MDGERFATCWNVASQVGDERMQSWVEVANVNEIAPGKMKHVEVEGKEIMIANVNGNFHAVSDRCGHTNAPMSMGGLKGNIVTCPLHGAQFDVTTGRKITEPKMGPLPNVEQLPESFLKLIEHSSRITGKIKTYDLASYELRVDDDKIKLKVPTY